MKSYPKEQILLWYEDYKDLSKSVKSITNKYNIKHDTLLKSFRRYSLKLRPSGFQATNAKGKYGLDLIKLAYIYVYKFAYKRRAVRKKLPFSITEEEFIEIVTKDCYYCGKDFKSETRKVNKIIIPMMTVDRINSKLGYVTENCVSCCKQCNTMKMDIPLEEWLNKMKIILDRLKN